ncbi:hypothetical protein TRVL_10046 [Trypanosoma vivax]|nr:hypothetical protein TRVL_10046 [Trypanosoma vivax]
MGHAAVDRLLRHVRGFRVYDRGGFALVPGEPCLALEDAMALLAYKFRLLLLLLLCLAVAVGCVLSLLFLLSIVASPGASVSCASAATHVLRTSSHTSGT